MAKSKKDIPEAMSRRCYNKLRYRCKHKNRYMDITFEQFVAICESNCVYCGGEPTETLWSGYRVPWFANGVDRIDSSKGYSLDNCQSCCSICNRLKSDLTEKDFLRHIKRIFTTRKLGELMDE